MPLSRDPRRLLRYLFLFLGSEGFTSKNVYDLILRFFKYLQCIFTIYRFFVRYDFSFFIIFRSGLIVEIYNEEIVMHV